MTGDGTKISEIGFEAVTSVGIIDIYILFAKPCRYYRRKKSYHDHDVQTMDIF